MTARTAAQATGRPAEPAARAWLADPYAEALRAGRGPLFLSRGDGWLLPLEVERWCAEADAADATVLARCEGAVLDVGCGPGRLVAALARLGQPALGVDVTPEAVARTVRTGGSALCRSVFDPLPSEGLLHTAPRLGLGDQVRIHLVGEVHRLHFVDVPVHVVRPFAGPVITPSGLPNEGAPERQRPAAPRAVRPPGGAPRTPGGPTGRP
ncbi:methyltransferase domain-containing protein [Streptomyces sp. NPDC001193]